MKRNLIIAATSAALLLPSGWSSANANLAPSTLIPSAFTLPVVGFGMPTVVGVAEPTTAVIAGGYASVAVPEAYAPAGTRLDAVRYRPRTRHRGYDRGPRGTSSSQIHAGFFDPEGSADNGFVLGLRGGPLVDPHVQIGLGADWTHRSENLTQIIGTTTGPGGTTIRVQRDLARSSSNLFPLMGFMQVMGDQKMSLIPYFGIAGGYEVLFLSGDDFTTGNSFDATYGGWAWQAWGGAAIPLSGRSRLVGEIFANRGDAHRDVEDAITGETFRETVDLDGVGMRFGLSWGF